MTYRKRGGLRFVQIGRFGFSFWISKPKTWHDDYANYYDEPNYPEHRVEGSLAEFNRYIGGDR